jgi:FkbM family methyltransferase
MKLKNNTFIQIGANLGNDNFTKICYAYKPKQIILIEPHEQCHSSLKECYKNLTATEIHYECVAIVDDPNIKEVEMLSPTGKTNHSSIVPMKDWTKEPFAKVPATTITEIFGKYSLSKVNLLYIDTEGNDARIINSIDFNKFQIDTIIYEAWNFKKEDFLQENFLNGVDGMNFINNKLTNLGYTISLIDNKTNYAAVKQ